MLRLKREESRLTFVITPPFDKSFFDDLTATIRDFIKVGNQAFCFDFESVKHLNPEDAHCFERIIPILQAKQCTLDVIHASSELLAAMPKLNYFVQNCKVGDQKKHKFSMETEAIAGTEYIKIKLQGDFMELDHLEKFKANAIQLLENHQALIIDCEKLSHVSTIAVGGFIFLKIHCDNTKKKIALVHISDSIEYTLDMTGILHIIPQYETLESALSSL